MPQGDERIILKRLKVFIIVYFFGMSSYAYAKKADFQYWQTDSVSWKAAADWKLTWSEEHYFKDDAGDYYYQEQNIGVIYSGLAKWLDLGLDYKHVIQEISPNKWKREERPHVNATLKFNLGGYSISDRNRFEYRIREDQTDYWRYRNLLTVKLPVKWTRQEIQPLVSDEIHVDLSHQEVNEIRLMPGFAFKITKNLNAEIVYMWRRVKSSGVWSTNNATWMRLKLEF